MRVSVQSVRSRLTSRRLRLWLPVLLYAAAIFLVSSMHNPPMPDGVSGGGIFNTATLTLPRGRVKDNLAVDGGDAGDGGAAGSGAGTGPGGASLGGNGGTGWNGGGIANAG